MSASSKARRKAKKKQKTAKKQRKHDKQVERIQTKRKESVERLRQQEKARVDALLGSGAAQKKWVVASYPKPKHYDRPPANMEEANKRVEERKPKIHDFTAADTPQEAADRFLLGTLGEEWQNTTGEDPVKYIHDRWFPDIKVIQGVFQTGEFEPPEEVAPDDMPEGAILLEGDCLGAAIHVEDRQEALRIAAERLREGEPDTVTVAYEDGETGVEFWAVLYDANREPTGKKIKMTLV